MFETSLAEDSRAANRWNTSSGGTYVAAGVGTAVTGRGADILLIDDPVKDREEADSEIRRNRVWEWYTSTAYTRLAPGGAVVLIQTRWHEDDLAGRLLEAQSQGGDQWDVLELPALSDHNEALWPERYDAEALERIRAAIGPRDWSALYQQAPSPEEGVFFKREWLNWYDEAPKHYYAYGASDYAVTDGGGDWTVHVVAGLDASGDVYVLDLWRGQHSTDVWIDAFLDMVDQHQPLMWAEEQGQIIKSVGPFIDRRMSERSVYCAREQFTSTRDKPTRARSFQAMAASGKVYLPRHAEWMPQFMNELLTFPAGKHDDQVDTVALLCRMLDQMVGKVPKNTNGPGTDRWDKIFDDEKAGSWRTA